jgi:hypothetical protein
MRWCSQNFVSAHTTASLMMKLDLEKQIIKASKQAINIMPTRRRRTRYKPWLGAWLKEADSVAHSESGI